MLISEGKEADRTLGGLMCSALEALHLGEFRIDENGFIVEVNAAASQLLGLPPETPLPERHFAKIGVLLQAGLGDEIGALLSQRDLLWKRTIETRDDYGTVTPAKICLWSDTDDHSRNSGLRGLIVPIEQRCGSSDMCESQHVQILDEVSTALSSSLELSQILRVILTGATAGQGLGFNRAFLFLVDKTESLLTGHMAVGPSSPEEAGRIWNGLAEKPRSLKEILEASASDPTAVNKHLTSLVQSISVPLESDSAVATACRSGRWCYLDNTDEPDQQTAELFDTLGVRDAVIVPMISSGRLQGMLLADNSITCHPISEHDVNLLQSLSNQAAVAMERARLYQAQRHRAEQLEKANQQLAESQDRLVTFEKMSIIGELTSAVAHELRNPLAIVGGFANLMLKNVSADDQREYLSIMSNEVRHMEGVLAQVLDFSRASKVENSAFEFGNMVEQTLELAQRRLRRPDMTISVSRPGRSLDMYGNYDQLSHAIYQIFRLIAEDIATGDDIEVRIEDGGDTARLQLRLRCADENKDNVRTALSKNFASNPATHRLPLMVASETLKYHGGTYELVVDEDTRMPSVVVELPISRE